HKLAGTLEDGPVLAEVLRLAGKRPKLAAESLMLRKTVSPDADVRAAALEALAELQANGAGEAVRKGMADNDTRVRRAAVVAGGKWATRPGIDPLLKWARAAAPAGRGAGLEALRRFHEPRAVPLAVAALEDRETISPALVCIGELGGPEQAEAVLAL